MVAHDKHLGTLLPSSRAFIQAWSRFQALCQGLGQESAQGVGSWASWSSQSGQSCREEDKTGDVTVLGEDGQGGPR